MKLSINKKIVNKNETNERSQAKGFEPVDVTTDEFASYIASGFAFSYQFSGSHRKADNFICSDIIAADFDHGMTLDEAMADEFLVNNACILYTTPSHTPENHRFRIVFQLPRTITDKEELRLAQRGLVRRFPADAAATDPARQFYGSRGSSPHIFGQVLSPENLAFLIDLGKEPINVSDNQDNKFGASGFRSSIALEDDIDVRDQRGNWVKLSELENSKPVYCPFHNDKNPSAHTTTSRSGVRGIHCSACQLTFWPKQREPEPYDFYAFEKLVKQKVADFVPELIEDEVSGFQFEPQQTINPNLVVSERYLPTIELGDGITLIKSPKGTGKTVYLKQLVAEYKRRNISVLLVGHRRSLLRALSSDLGLRCYLDVRQGGFIGADIPKHFAVSVDSLATMLHPARNKFDVVLIDESEQVFSHLISDTIETEKRRKCYLLLQHYVHVAKRVVALDADLNHITLHAIQRFGSKNPLSDRRFILNDYKFPAKSVEMYGSDNHLVGDLFTSLREGKRIFVCANSKQRIDALVLSIQDEFGTDFPLFWVTSENSGDGDVSHFISNIKTEILNYRVLLVSPAMGTGLDITFPDDVTNVEGVYGFFESRVNTHLDIDQQISRVRHPNFVRVWISAESFNFETEVDPIKQELAESGIIPEILTGYSNTGLPEFNWTDPYLTLFATILSAQRASKNRLKKNFIDLKTHNGCSIVDITKDQDVALQGALHSMRGDDLREDEYVRNLLNAELLDGHTANRLMEKRDAGKALTTPEKHSLERYWFDTFYLQPATPELLLKDNHGKYRDQIRLLEEVLQPSRKSAANEVIKAKGELIRVLLIASGVLGNEGKFDTTITITDASLAPFVTQCKKRKLTIERVLGSDLRRDFDKKPMMQLGSFLKMCGLKTVKEKPITSGSQKIYEYRLDPSCLNDALRLIDRRREQYD